MIFKFVENTGKFLIDSAVVSGRAMILLKKTAVYSPYLLKKPKNIIEPLYTCMVRPLLLVAAVSFLTGIILAMQTGRAMMDFGFEDQVGGLVAVVLAREMGPLWAAVIVTAAVGSSIAAELGTMNVTEQIAAVESMGTDPVKYLVAPRVLACVLLTPFLIVYADLLGILGGWFVSVVQLGINQKAYWEYSAQGVELWDVATGVLKGVFFGSAIAVISCYKGFTCKEGAHGVGQACTEAFVGSFISILVLNFVFAVIMKAVYSTFWSIESLL